jgi:hypothetical protein
MVTLVAAAWLFGMLAVDPRRMVWPPNMNELQPGHWICDDEASSSSRATSIHKAGMTERNHTIYLVFYVIGKSKINVSFQEDKSSGFVMSLGGASSMLAWRRPSAAGGGRSRASSGGKSGCRSSSGSRAGAAAVQGHRQRAAASTGNQINPRESI